MKGKKLGFNKDYFLDHHVIKKESGKVTVEGKIVEARDGQKKIRRNYTYGYRSLRIQVGVDYYSVLINSKKFNDYGFLPKVGQWIRVKGRLSETRDDFDPSISWVSSLEHIEPPEDATGSDITTRGVLNALTIRWQSLSQIATKMKVEGGRRRKALKEKLDLLTRRGAIAKNIKRKVIYWRNPDA